MILTIRSKFFERLCETFYRHALEDYTWNRLVQKKNMEKKKEFLVRKRLTITDLFKGLWFGPDTLSPLAPALGPQPFQNRTYFCFR